MELQFKAESRQAKLLGLWVAEQLGRDGDSAEQYAKEVVVSGLHETGNDGILAKVTPDFEAKGIARTTLSPTTGWTSR